MRASLDNSNASQLNSRNIRRPGETVIGSNTRRNSQSTPCNGYYEVEIDAVQNSMASSQDITMLIGVVRVFLLAIFNDLSQKFAEDTSLVPPRISEDNIHESTKAKKQILCRSLLYHVRCLHRQKRRFMTSSS